AENHGACLRPVQLRRTNTATGEVDQVLISCGATLADICPPCAERAKELRPAQCREGCHLTPELRPPGLPGNPAPGRPRRRQRSTRSRQDAPHLPTRKISPHTVGMTYTAPDGKTFRPSMFITLTCPRLSSSTKGSSRALVTYVCSAEERAEASPRSAISARIRNCATAKGPS